MHSITLRVFIHRNKREEYRTAIVIVIAD